MTTQAISHLTQAIIALDNRVWEGLVGLENEVDGFAIAFDNLEQSVDSVRQSIVNALQELED